MSNKSNDEKFISIEYETWKNKYLPLEEANRWLKMQLEEDRTDKIIELQITGIRGYGHINNYEHDYFRRNNKISFLDFDILGKPYESKNRENIIAQVINILRSDQNTNSLNFLTRQEFQECEKSLRSKRTEVDRIKEENNSRFNKIPKFIKWLFRIKTL